ncbi:MAG TPA: hypothetical protein VMT63_09020 [Bacteroidales bacterium]|nr:hypothetical protein [Bacteroidales bacterium]
MENNLSSADELKTIRKIMEESSRFLSLSGLSGVSAGLFAVAGTLVAWLFILKGGSVRYDEYFRSLSQVDTFSLRWQLVADALAVLGLSSFFALYFSVRKARKAGNVLWTPVTKRLLLNFSIPLATGGIFIIILLLQNHIQLLVPGMLIFYGLALLNAGKFTYGEIFYLGLLEIILGLIAALMPSFGLYFWVFGFGILHIVYGFFMYRKYES